MQHLYKDLGILDPGTAVTVALRSQANVRLMTSSDYTQFKHGNRYRYFGGRATRSPVVLKVPQRDRWVVVVDLGGYPGRVSASITVTHNTASRQASSERHEETA